MLVIVIGIFGMIGAMLRYGLGQLTFTWSHGPFPLATFIANLLGCFILGWLTTYVNQRARIHTYIKKGIGTGLIGSFTTFSTFSVDAVQLIQSGLLTLGLFYIAASLFGGWMLGYLGYKIGALFIGRYEKGNVR